MLLEEFRPFCLIKHGDSTIEIKLGTSQHQKLIEINIKIKLSSDSSQGSVFWVDGNVIGKLVITSLPTKYYTVKDQSSKLITLIFNTHSIKLSAKITISKLFYLKVLKMLKLKLEV